MECLRLKRIFSRRVRAARINLLCLLLLSVTPVTVHASDKHPLDNPVSDIILHVSGNIKKKNSSDGALFDFRMLESLPSYSLTTLTPWYDTTQHFEGVRLSDLLKRVGVDRESRIYARALNDYDVEIPADIARRYDLLLVYKKDGKPLKIRDKGPIRILSSFEQHPELRRLSKYLIWQISEIVVR